LSSTATRVLISVIAIPVILGLTLLGGYYFFALVELLVVLGIWEYYGFIKTKGAFFTLSLGWLFGGTLCALFFFDREEWLVPLLILFLMAELLTEIYKNKKEANFNVSATTFGTLYVALFFGCLIELRELPGLHGFDYLDGGKIIVAIYASVWVCDSAAYFGGRALGRHKLFERVSPKKTVEGFLFGVLGAVGGVFLAQFLPYLGISEGILGWVDLVVIGLITGTIGQWGDLAESLLKRDAGVKDSSNLIPGHGGVLDRFDSLLFVAPAVYLYLHFYALS